jgi:peptidoglycan/LPS O-acetylase OafA/YrhL
MSKPTTDHTAQTKVNIPFIVTLRGLAALMVCLYHFVCTTTGYINTTWITDTFWFGQKGVQVFFIISGIVIPLSMIQWEYHLKLFWKFLYKRFVRIEPPYLLSVAMGVAYLIFRNSFGGSADVDLTPTLRDVLLHIGYLVPFVDDAHWVNQVYWTLSVEFQYYLCLAVLFPLALSKSRWLHVLFVLAFLIPPYFVDSKNFFPHWSAFFLMGIAYALWLTKRWLTSEFVITLLLSLAICLQCLPLVDVVFGSVTLAVIALMGQSNWSWGNKLGLISYSLYLIHPFIGGAFINFMSHRFVQPWEKFLVIGSGTALSLAAAYVFYRIIERPAQDWSRRVGQ